MIKYAIILLSLFLFSCSQYKDQLTIAVCLDGNEIAELRENCLSPMYSDAPYTYDPTACRQVQVNLSCDNPETGSIGVLYLIDGTEVN